MGLFSDTIPTAKFNQVGDKVVGIIVRFDQQQRTEFIPGGGVGAPMFWHNGRPVAGVASDPQTGEPNRPVMDKVIVLDTDEADQYGEKQRRLFIKSKQMLTGIKEACTAVGVRDVDEGGRLACTWASGAGRTGSPKVYAFEYDPPGTFTAEEATTPVSTEPAQRTTADSVLGKPAAANSAPPF